MLKIAFSGLQRCRWLYGSIFIRLAVVASLIGEMPRNSLKIRTYTVRGHPRSSILVLIKSSLCKFLLVTNSNFGRTCISYSFRDIDAFIFKIACFSHPPLFCAAWGTPYNINIIYTLLKSTFTGLQVCGRHYGSIFIRLAVVAFQNREIMTNSDKIWPYCSSRSSKVNVNVNDKCKFI